MKHSCTILAFICSLVTSTVIAYTIIRPATTADLSTIFDFDRRISFEYFKPLYMQGYSHLPLGKNPDYFLELELQHDKKWFPECIKENSNEPLYIAIDQQNKNIAGFIIFHKATITTLQIDLLLIDADYRRQGIGKRLMHTAYDHCKEATECIVYPLRSANADTLSFYQSLGFKDAGAATLDKLNIYGIPYGDMYYFYKINLVRRSRHIEPYLALLQPLERMLGIR